jgi:hypothetical protein
MEHVMPQLRKPTTVRWTLQLEGLTLAVVALALYAYFGFSWWMLALFFLVPDLSMVGYLAGPRLGAAAYNAVHTTITPLLLGALALYAGWLPGVQIALIWLIHIGVDRTVGYGLKMPDDFKRTHLTD